MRKQATPPPSLESIIAEIDKILDGKLDQRLGEFERQLLEQFRQENRQQSPEELIEEDRQIIPDARPDYQAVRDRVLTKLKLGKQSASGKAIDAFIRELQKQEAGNVNPKGEELTVVT